MVLPVILFFLIQAATTLAGPAVCSLADRRACQAPETTETGPLMLSVVVPDTITDLNDLSVRTTILNTGDKTLKILNDPNSPLNPIKTHSFDFFKIPEIGAKVPNASCPDASPSNGVVWYDIDPYEVAAEASEDAYIILEPKQKKSMVKDLSGMYMFPQAGLYTVRVTQSARYFAIVKDDGSVDFTQARMRDGPAADTAAAFMLNKWALDPKTGIAKRQHPTDSLVSWIPSPMFHQCTPAQQEEVRATIKAAVQRLKQIDIFLSDPNSMRTTRYANWFGGPSRARWIFVWANFLSIGTKPAEYKYDCTCTKCDRAAFTFTHPTDKIPTIYLCKKFWWAQRTGEYSKAGVLIREALHYTAFANPTEYALGTASANRYAMDNPALAVYNSGSYQFFAENARVTPDDSKYLSTTYRPKYRPSQNRPSRNRPAQYRPSQYRPLRNRPSQYRPSKNRPARYQDSRYRDSRYRPNYRASKNSPNGKSHRDDWSKPRGSQNGWDSPRIAPPWWKQGTKRSVSSV